MRYFMLKQDRNIPNAVEIIGFNNSQKVVFLKEDEDKYKDASNVPVKGTINTIYPSFLQAPTLLVCDELHKLFKLYENTIIYKIAVLTNVELRKQKVYRLMITDVIDAIDEKTTYQKNGWLHKLVLNKKKIGDYNIFQVKAGVDYYFIVSLDVLESMLKRNLFIGIKFEEVEVI